MERFADEVACFVDGDVESSSAVPATDPEHERRPRPSSPAATRLPGDDATVLGHGKSSQVRCAQSRIRQVGRRQPEHSYPRISTDLPPLDVNQQPVSWAVSGSDRLDAKSVQPRESEPILVAIPTCPPDA